MGRTRSFVELDAIAACSDVFLRTGYEGSSIDELVTATGVHRASLYGAFGSKRGMFLAALEQVASVGVADSASVDLVLVALMELAPRDEAVRARVASILSDAGGAGTAEQLGSRLLERARIAPASNTDESGKDAP